MTNATDTERLRGMARSPLLRVMLLGALILLLQVPIFMISGQIHSRQQTRGEAHAEVTSMWGRDQLLIGPILSLPYIHRWSENRSDGTTLTRQETRTLRVLPEVLKLSGKLDTESRYRGIFEFPVYRGDLVLEGHFLTPDLAERGIAPTDVLWGRAELAMHVSDPRAIQQPAQVHWNGAAIELRPGVASLGEVDHPGIGASLKGHMSAPRFTFKLPLQLKGSGGFRLAPMAKATELSLKSDWPHPSFKGNWLPDSRTIRSDGFTARWSVGYLGRNFPQIWQHGADYSKAVCDSAFGFELNTQVDQYRMAERSVKYALLFLGFTFVLIWLYEVLGALRVHPIQYLLLGGSLCLFYLLLLALAEHIGFGSAYALGAVLVTVQVTAYSLAALKKAGRALLLSFVVGGLYTYLYVLLQLQDYALLIGAIGLFLALTVVMYTTRRVDWYAVQQALPLPSK